VGGTADTGPPAASDTHMLVLWEGTWYRGHCAWCRDLREIVELAHFLEGPHAQRIAHLAVRLLGRQRLMREGWWHLYEPEPVYTGPRRRTTPAGQDTGGAAVTVAGPGAALGSDSTPLAPCLPSTVALVPEVLASCPSPGA
jgi:hypothetical protein